MERNFVNKLVNYQKTLNKEDEEAKLTAVPENRRKTEEGVRYRKSKGTQKQARMVPEASNGEWLGDSPLTGTIRKGRANVKKEQNKRRGDPRTSHFLRFS